MPKIIITPEGRQYRQELADRVLEIDPNSNIFQQLEDIRHLWILDQYAKGKTDLMTSPIMGPEFELLVEWGYLEQLQKL